MVRIEGLESTTHSMAYPKKVIQNSYTNLKMHALSPPNTRALLNNFSPTSPSFNAWTRLTDAYAKQFVLMQNGNRSAREEAMKLAAEVQRMNLAMREPVLNFAFEA